MNLNNEATRVVVVLVVLVLGIIGVALFAGNKKSDTNTNTPSSNNSSKTTKSSTAETKKSEATKNVSYTYIAQPGDSYTLFARKAVQTYASANKKPLSHAQIIYAETVLTRAAGSPDLNIGESKSFTESSLKSVVTKALNLTNAQQALWNTYAQSANFDTSHVGVA